MVSPLAKDTRTAKTVLLAQRRVAYVLVLLGIVMVNAAYIRLLSQGLNASLTLPLIVAVLGLLVATLGFTRFADYQRRQRGLFPLTDVASRERTVVLAERSAAPLGPFSRN